MNGEPVAYSQSFFEVVYTSGPIGILIWIFILILSITAPILGIFSIINCSRANPKQNPLAFKLLFVGITALFMTGIYGALNGVIDTLFGFATLAGSEQAQIVSLSSSQAIYSFSFAIQGCFIYLFFITISLIVLHFQQKKFVNNDADSSINNVE